MQGRLVGDGTRIPIRPFSDYKTKFFCWKKDCNTPFSTENLLEIHDRFYHTEYPLGGESSKREENPNQKIRGDAEDVIMDAEIVPKEPSEDRMYQTMLKMSSQFFDEFLGKVRKEELPVEGG